jgi:hypothetical protein
MGTMSSSDSYFSGVAIAAMILIAKHGLAVGLSKALFVAWLSWLYVVYAVIERIFA